MASDQITNNRLKLQTKLEELLGTREVYYQPPTSKQMSYPCIRYSKKSIEYDYANNSKYRRKNCYELIVIDRLPDNDVIDKLLELPYCSYDRHYTADNLNHDVLTLYF